MLTTYNISKKYKGNKEDSLKDFTYQFDDTGFYLIVGPSGAGKSTLLGILSGIDRQYEGYFVYDDQKIDDRNRINYRNEISSIVFQSINLIESLTIKENLRIAFDLAREKFDIEKCRNLLEKVHLPDGNENLEDFLKKRPNQLSLGQKQRLAIARSIIKKGKILFLDEPTSSLDKENADRIATILNELSKTMLVIVVTHSLEDFSSIESPKDILTLKDGKQSCQGKIDTKPIKKTIRKRNSEISLSSSFALARTNLFASKIKLFLSLFITIISLSCLACFYTIKNIDRNEVYLKAQNEIDQKLAIFYLNFANKDQSEDDESEKNLVLLDEQKKILSEMNAHDVFKSGLTAWNYLVDDKYESSYYNIPSLWFCFYGNYSNYFMEIFNEDDPNFKMDSRLKSNPKAHFPQTYDEIAISSFYADTLSKYGSETNGFKKDDVNELIGKEIFGYTITNIYTTKDSAILSKMNDETIELDERVKLAQDSSYAQFFYVAPGFHQQYVPFDPGDDEEPENEEPNLLYYVFEYQSYKEALKKLRSLEMRSENGKYHANIISLFAGREILTIIIDTEMAPLFYYVILFFLILSILSLLLLFLSNIEKERYSYGVLLSMGCSSKSLFMTLLIKAAMLLFIVFTLTLFISSIAFWIYNAKVSLPLLSVKFRMILLILGILLSISLLLALLGTIKSAKTNITKLLKD